MPARLEYGFARKRIPECRRCRREPLGTRNGLVASERLAGGSTRSEALKRLAARHRDAAPIGEKTAGDSLSIWDELTADGHGVVHASLPVLLLIGPCGGRCERETESGEYQCNANLHDPLVEGASSNACLQRTNEKASTKFLPILMNSASPTRIIGEQFALFEFAKSFRLGPESA